MHEPLANRANDLLVETSLDELALLNQHVRILWTTVRIFAILLLQEIQIWDQEREYLFTCPEWLGLQDCRGWKHTRLTVRADFRNPHEELHGLLEINERVSLRHQHRT